MNLAMAPMHVPLEIVKVRKRKGQDEQDQFLANLGLVTGAKISVITEVSGNLIVNVKDSRLALGKDLALLINVVEI